VVDSSTTSVPARSSRPAVSVAAVTAVRSGPSDSDSGVGTQMTITSAPPAPPGSVVARKPPPSMTAMSAPDRSSMCDRPAFRPSAVACLMSRPMTRRSALRNHPSPYCGPAIDVNRGRRLRISRLPDASASF
jgi:hypothetical protein